MTIDFIASYRELLVYQMAVQGSIAVYRWAQPLLETSDIYLIRQFLTTSRAVHSHIATAWGQRRHRENFIADLSSAQWEAAEMQIWIEAAITAGYLTPNPGQDLYDHYRTLYTALDQLMATAAVVPNLPENLPANPLPATA